MTAYTPQACSPQWKNVIVIACRAASGVPAVATGGFAKCVTGSATPKNMIPMPIPALKSMANQEGRPNAGRSSSGPSRSAPRLPSRAPDREEQEERGRADEEPAPGTDDPVLESDEELFRPLRIGDAEREHRQHDRGR